MKKFAVLCIVALVAYQVSGAALPADDDNAGLPGVIDKAVGLVGGLAGSVVSLPGELIKLGDDGKGGEGKGGLNLGSILKGLPILG